MFQKSDLCAAGEAVPPFPNLGSTQQLLFQDAQDECSSCNSGERLALMVKTFSFPLSPYCLCTFNIHSHKDNSFVLKIFLLYVLGFFVFSFIIISSILFLVLQPANQPLVYIRSKNN